MNKYNFFLFWILFISGCYNSTGPDRTPPSITIAFPIDGSAVSEIVTITALATDNAAIKKVNLWVDGRSIEGSEDNSEPYELKWNTVSYEDNSAHTITARAFDKSDNVADSDPIILTVDNTNARPTQINLNPILYQDAAFIITWSPSKEEDFDSYALYEALSYEDLSKDMSGEVEIFTSKNRIDTMCTVTNISENEKRYYRLSVTDMVGLETLSAIRSVVAKEIFVKEGLIAYYPFNGNANDESGSENHGIIIRATPTEDKDGNANSAYSFNGISDYIRIDNYVIYNDLSSFTLSAWIYPTQVKSHNSIISKVNPNRDFNLKINGLGKLEIHFAYLATYYACRSDEAIPLNTWSHVAALWTGTEWRLYYNGNLVNKCNYSGTLPPWTGTCMGIGTLNWREFFSGKIDEVRIYNRALTEEEIQMLAQ